MRSRNGRFELGILVTLAAVGCVLVTAKRASPAPGKIFAQQLVEKTLAKHSQLAGVELSSTPPHKKCETIASTEAKDVGEKCDADEFTAMKSNKPFAEKEVEEGKEVFDVTMPLHDATGKLIGTVGMDFKPEPDQTEAKVIQLAQEFSREIEAKLPSKATLFESAK